MLILPETCRFSYHITKRMASFLISMIKFSRLHSQQTRDKDGVLFILCCCGINEDCRFIFSTSIFFFFFFLVTVWAASSLGKTEGFAEGCEAVQQQQAKSTLLLLVKEGAENVSLYTIYLLFILKFWQPFSSF